MDASYCVVVGKRIMMIVVDGGIMVTQTLFSVTYNIRSKQQSYYYIYMRHINKHKDIMKYCTWAWHPLLIRPLPSHFLQCIFWHFTDNISCLGLDLSLSRLLYLLGLSCIDLIWGGSICSPVILFHIFMLVSSWITCA